MVPPRRTTPVHLLAEGRAISLDLGAETAAAIFRHGDWLIAVFDRPEALDLSQLQGSTIFRNMEARQTGDATILQMRLAQPGTLRPRREGNAWVFEAFRDAVDANRALTAITSELDQGPPARLLLRVLRPGRSVTVLDPETGSPLLVGTLREAGQAVAIGRRQPEFQLLPAMLGVAVLPRGDNIQLRALSDRFILQAAGMDSPISLPPGRLLVRKRGATRRKRCSRLVCHKKPRPWRRSPCRKTPARALMRGL